MQKNPTQYLAEIAWGYRRATVLQIANNLDLFTHLAEKPLTLTEICQACDTKPEPTEKLLIACIALDLLQREGNRYRNSPIAEQCLVRGRPFYQGNIIAHAATMGDVWQDMENEIRTEPAAPLDEQTRHRNFILGMVNITRAGRGQLFLDSIDLSDRRKMLDVGGGPGMYSILAAQKYSDLRAVVFDLPPTIAIAREVIAQEHAESSVSVQPGDWDTDDFGRDRDYDVVLFSNVLHGPNSAAAAKLEKAHDVMLPGGLLVIQEFLLNDDKTGPLMPALFNLMVGAYATGELLDVIGEAGFTDAQCVAHSPDLAASWITARKP